MKLLRAWGLGLQRLIPSLRTLNSVHTSEQCCTNRTHATTSATLNNTLMSVMMDEDEDLTDKFFRLGAVGHLEKLTNPDEAMAARGRAHPKLIARSKLSAEGARRQRSRILITQRMCLLGRSASLTSRNSQACLPMTLHKLWVMRHKAAANVLGDFLVARAFAAYDLAGN